MSRIGRSPIAIPPSVTVAQHGRALAFEGPKGKLGVTLPDVLSALLQDSPAATAVGAPASPATGVAADRQAGGKQLVIQRSSDLKNVKALHGLYRALAANVVRGLTDGFTRELEIIGVGYRAQVQAKHLELYVGFSHPVRFPIPEGITIETPKPTSLIVKGVDRQLVGQVAANLRRVAPPEPYKGKGIRYAGEVIRRKAGKAATGAKGSAAG